MALVTGAICLLIGCGIGAGLMLVVLIGRNWQPPDLKGATDE